MIKRLFPKALIIFVILTFICGVLYTGVVTGIAQVFFPKQANGSIIEVDGKKYGSVLLGQQYTDNKHMWGRIMNIDVSTYQDENGQTLMYGGPSNLSPASEEYEELIAQRVQKIKKAHPEMKNTAIPEDLVTCSGSGLDPHISIAAAQYQAKRLAKYNNISEEKINDIIDQCTQHKFLGVFGEDVVNVLEVNLMIDGILK